MEYVVDAVVSKFESGQISRRQLVAQLSAMAAGATFGIGAHADEVAAPVAEAVGPSFQALGFNHIALRVTDVARSRDFYAKHLGLTLANESSGSAFMNFGSSFLALFRGDTPGLHHYCYAVENYNVLEAEKKLRALGLNPDQPKGTDRIYFDDPDGIEVQLSSADHLA
ncbi:MAG: VOC family protein [Candidatus Hydrogenedentes bacterium]|nr:VOC family protein [Candidatus Hydrogenedentota bacterium]